MNNRNLAVRSIPALGLAAALLFGMTGTTPARADDRQLQRDRQNIRREINDIRRDERRLTDLQDKRDRLAFRRDWRGVRDTDREIARLRDHIAHDRADVRRFIAQYRYDRFRDSDPGFWRDLRDFDGDGRPDRFDRDDRFNRDRDGRYDRDRRFDR